MGSLFSAGRISLQGTHQWRTHEFCSGVSTNSVEDREKGDLGAVAPYSGVLEAAVIWYKKNSFHIVKFS